MAGPSSRSSTNSAFAQCTENIQNQSVLIFGRIQPRDERHALLLLRWPYWELRNKGLCLFRPMFAAVPGKCPPLPK